MHKRETNFHISHDFHVALRKRTLGENPTVTHVYLCVEVTVFDNLAETEIAGSLQARWDPPVRSSSNFSLASGSPRNLYLHLQMQYVSRARGRGYPKSAESQTGVGQFCRRFRSVWTCVSVFRFRLGIVWNFLVRNFGRSACRFPLTPGVCKLQISAIGC